MRSKRFLSTVVATALVVTTMVVPVMAAEQTGSVNVDVSTKTGILRVQVPTKMSMEIDQFEITQQGSQIASGVFDMHNYSEMDVSVVAESTATLKDGVSLVSSRAVAEDSTGDEAWLAVAAQTAAGGSYDDAATTDATENYYDLTEANANVATFASDTKKAAQTFYLAKGTGNTQYQLAVPDAAEQVEKEVSQYYKLTPLATTPTNDATLQTAVDASDVYVVVTANVGKDGETVTVIPKGTTVAGGANAWDGDNSYYTADATTSTPAAGSVYVYPSKGTVGGEAAFRYVGKLSDAKASWTKDDITGVTINYTITGITATNYAEVVNDCTYGLYKEPAPADVAPTFETGDAVGQIKYTAGTGDDAVATITKIEMTNTYGTFDGYNAGAAYAAATDVAGVVTFDSAFMAFFTEGATIQAKVTYTTTSGATKDTMVSVKLQ